MEEQTDPRESSESLMALAAETLQVNVPYPDPTETAVLAYSYWEARGGEGGSAEADWFRAEAELRGRGTPLATSTPEPVAVLAAGK